MDSFKFSELPDAEKDKIFAEIESKTPEQILAESRPLNRKERALWKELKKKMGRPKVGKGSNHLRIPLSASGRRALKGRTRVSITVEIRGSSAGSKDATLVRTFVVRS